MSSRTGGVLSRKALVRHVTRPLLEAAADADASLPRRISPVEHCVSEWDARQRMSPLGKLIVAVVLVVAFVCLGGGMLMIVGRESGTRTTAKVADCAEHGRFGTYCTGTWIEGGSLVGGRGNVIVGRIDGAMPSDVGRTIDVTVTGDHAHTYFARAPDHARHPGTRADHPLRPCW
jgi:hypothetical protein